MLICYYINQKVMSYLYNELRTYYNVLNKTLRQVKQITSHPHINTTVFLKLPTVCRFVAKSQKTRTESSPDVRTLLDALWYITVRTLSLLQQNSVGTLNKTTTHLTRLNYKDGMQNVMALLRFGTHGPHKPRTGDKRMYGRMDRRQTDVRTYGRIDGRTDGKTDVQAIDESMDGRTDGRTGRTDGRTDGWREGRKDGDRQTYGQKDGRRTDRRMDCGWTTFRRSFGLAA